MYFNYLKASVLIWRILLRDKSNVAMGTLSNRKGITSLHVNN